MACCQTNSNRGFIYETLLKIDQLQKAANVESACEGCEGSLVSAFFNTKPISIYLCGGNKLTADVITDDPLITSTTTTLFRIENVKTDSVVLRILVPNNGETICTNHTIVANIDCICALQCYLPICCPSCKKCPQ